MTKFKSFLSTRRKSLAFGGVGIALIVGALFIGMALNDESQTVSDLEGELAKVENELADEESEVGYAEEEKQRADQKAEEAEEALNAERKLNGSGPKQVADREYNTDFPWEAAGTVGIYTIKPISWELQGEKYILFVEAKNESREPQSPFCGGAEAIVLDAEENQYTGESLLAEGTDNCEELQPGETGRFGAEFKIASNAVPVVVAIYAEYEQEEEAKTWELPR